MRIVLDTNVLVSATLNPHGIPGRILDGLLSGEYKLVVDDRILDEYRDVLSRSRFNFMDYYVNNLLEFFYHEAEHETAAPFPLDLRDPNDKPFLEVAIQGKVDALITGNLKDFPRSPFLGIKILSPAEFLKEFS